MTVKIKNIIEIEREIFNDSRVVVLNNYQADVRALCINICYTIKIYFGYSYLTMNISNGKPKKFNAFSII